MSAQVQWGRNFAILATLAVVFVFSGTAMAANKLIVKGTDGTTDKFVVTDGGYLGIGNSNPGTPIQVTGAGNSGVTTFEMNNLGALPYDRYNAPTFQVIRNNDSSVNSGLPLIDDRLGYFNFGAMFSGTFRSAAGLGAYAASSSGSSTSFPGYLTFETTSNGQMYPVERLRVTSGGYVGIGTTNPQQRLDVNGAIRFNTSGSRPNCTSANHGTLWIVAGNTESLQICLYVSGSYSWQAISISPAP